MSIEKTHCRNAFYDLKTIGTKTKKTSNQIKAPARRTTKAAKTIQSRGKLSGNAQKRVPSPKRRAQKEQQNSQAIASSGSGFLKAYSRD